MPINLNADIAESQVSGELLESPVWDGRSGQIFCVDIKLTCIWRIDSVTGSAEKFQVNFVPTALFLTNNVEVLLVASRSMIYKFNHVSGSIECWLEFPQEPQGNRFNDGRVIDADTILLGSMDNEGVEFSGALYCVGSNKKIERIFSRIGISNGVSIVDEVLFYTDSKRGWLRKYALPSWRGIEIDDFQQEIGADVLGGAPDGHCIDSNGNLWVAVWGGGKIVALNKDLKILAYVRLPSGNISSVCIADTRQSHVVLWVTSASSDGNVGRLYKITLNDSRISLGHSMTAPAFNLIS